MIIYGYHGALAEENSLGQRFEIDLEFQFSAEETSLDDQLKKTISYVDVYQLVCETVTQHQFKLLETLGGKIIDRIKVQFPQLLHILVRIRKPAVPLPGVLDHVEVELSWDHSDQDV